MQRPRGYFRPELGKCPNARETRRGTPGARDLTGGKPDAALPGVGTTLHEMKSEFAPLAVDFVRPAFIVGVTGHMDLDPAYRDQIKDDFQRIFKWICDRSERSDDALGAGLALTHTPIVLLSSLAPGADQWIVSTAREVDHRAGLRVLAPLPFIKDQYLEASTFQREGIDEEASRFVAEFP